MIKKKKKNPDVMDLPHDRCSWTESLLMAMCGLWLDGCSILFFPVVCFLQVNVIERAYSHGAPSK